MTQDKHVVTTYRGVEVALEGTTKRFVAVVGGVRLWAPSFEAIKKKIEEGCDFAPFDALMLERNGPDGVITVKVIGVKREGPAVSYVIELVTGVPDDEEGSRRTLGKYDVLYEVGERAALVAWLTAAGAERERQEQARQALTHMRKALKRLPRADGAKDSE